MGKSTPLAIITSPQSKHAAHVETGLSRFLATQELRATHVPLDVLLSGDHSPSFLEDDENNLITCKVIYNATILEKVISHAINNHINLVVIRIRMTTAEKDSGSGKHHEIHLESGGRVSFVDVLCTGQGSRQITSYIKEANDIFTLIRQYASNIWPGPQNIFFLQSQLLAEPNAPDTHDEYRQCLRALIGKFNGQVLRIYCSAEKKAIRLTEELAGHVRHPKTTDIRDTGIHVVRALDKSNNGVDECCIDTEEIYGMKIPDESIRMLKINTDIMSRFEVEKALLEIMPGIKSTRRARFGKLILDLDSAEENQLIIASPQTIDELVNYFDKSRITQDGDLIIYTYS